MLSCVFTKSNFRKCIPNKKKRCCSHIIHLHIVLYSSCILNRSGFSGTVDEPTFVRSRQKNIFWPEPTFGNVCPTKNSFLVVLNLFARVFVFIYVAFFCGEALRLCIQNSPRSQNGWMSLATQNAPCTAPVHQK